MLKFLCWRHHSHTATILDVYAYWIRPWPSISSSWWVSGPTLVWLHLGLHRHLRPWSELWRLSLASTRRRWCNLESIPWVYFIIQCVEKQLPDYVSEWAWGWPTGRDIRIRRRDLRSIHSNLIQAKITSLNRAGTYSIHGSSVQSGRILRTFWGAWVLCSWNII